MVNGWVADQVGQLREAVPPVDTVRRWVAPYAGTVQISSTASLLDGAPGNPGAGDVGCPQVGVGGTSTDAALVRVQVETTEVAVCALRGFGESRTVDRSVRVGRGDSVYFRFSPATASSAQEVSWDQRIEYTAVDGIADLAALPADPEGRSTTSFSWASAFSASGRPAMVGLPAARAGEMADLSGLLTKARTSDDLTFTVLRHPVPDSTSTGSTSTGSQGAAGAGVDAGVGGAGDGVGCGGRRPGA